MGAGSPVSVPSRPVGKRWLRRAGPGPAARFAAPRCAWRLAAKGCSHLETQPDCLRYASPASNTRVPQPLWLPAHTGFEAAAPLKPALFARKQRIREPLILIDGAGETLRHPRRSLLQWGGGGLPSPPGDSRAPTCTRTHDTPTQRTAHSGLPEHGSSGANRGYGCAAEPASPALTSAAWLACGKALHAIETK